MPLASTETMFVAAPQDAMEDLDEACRILTVSASVDAARSFVGLVQALSPSSSSFSSSSSSHSTATSTSTPPPTPTPHIIPYTLSNRYYTADLHFALGDVDAVSLHSFLAPRGSSGRGGEQRPPAVIFVWVHGEPYAKHVRLLSESMQAGEYDPEVRLAVRIPRGGATGVVVDSAAASNSNSNSKDQGQDQDQQQEVNEDEAAQETQGEEEEEDNAEIDSTLMSYGFEYVDATRGRRGDDDDIDIPGLPRVIDALSTIMWPSMRAPSLSSSPFSASAKGGPRTQKEPTPLTASQRKERSSIMEELLSISEISEMGLGAWGGSVLVGEEEVEGEGEGGEGERERDNEEGEEEEEELGTPVDFSYGFDKRSDVPWLSGARKGTGAGTGPGRGLSLDSQNQGGGARGKGEEGQLTASPVDINGLSPFGFEESGGAGAGGAGGRVSIGFEDDFTVFVSAPPPGAAPNSSTSALDSVSISGGGGSKAQERTAPPRSLDSLLGHDLRGGGHANANAYRTLGSVSDFGGSDFGDGQGDGEGAYEALEDVDADADEDREGWEDRDEKEWEEEGLEEEEGDEEEVEGDEDDWDEEEGLPSKEEIRQAARRIFGVRGVPEQGDVDKGKGRAEEMKGSGSGVFARASDVLKEQQSQQVQDQEQSQEPLPKERTDTNPNGSSKEMKERMRRLGGMAAAADVRGAFGFGPGQVEGEGEETGDGDEGAGAFDLERVLHSLQAMRGEIMGIEDEDEKRKAAARVALGLVYGLGEMEGDELSDGF